MVFNNIGHIIDIEMLRSCYQELDGKKATGVDGMTKQEFGFQLEDNLASLLMRIRRGTYIPQPSRIVEIPKEDGTKRPLAISCLEDKIVQLAVAKVLEAIYEPIFLNGSYGFRPERDAHKALRELNHQMYRNRNGAIVEIDIKQYFNTIPQPYLENMLKKKISDSRFLGLLHKILKAPVLTEGGAVVPTTAGVPQGSICSPILANIYLHYVADMWIEDLCREGHLIGRTKVIRYADDLVFTFEIEREAERFFNVLPKRLEKYGLKINLDKSSLQKGGSKSIARGKIPKPKFKFLGFEVRWIKSRKGTLRPAYTPRLDRMNKRLQEIKKYLQQRLNARDHMEVLKSIKSVVVGWVNYFAISDCGPRIWAFITRTRYYIYKWFNRRGGKKYISWEKVEKILAKVGIVCEFKTKSMFST
jgi:group II intron reverse transcriptase/maturase